MVRSSLFAVALFLSACTSAPPEVMYVPQRVEVPVPYRLPAPDHLAKPYKPASLPKFISPRDPRAAAGISREDLNHLKTLLRTLTTRDKAWRAWAEKGERDE